MKVPAKAMAFTIAGVGFTSLLGQVLLVRESSTWLRGNEFVIACIVAAWLLWTALGCAIAYRLTRGPRWHAWLTTGWFLAVALACIELVLLRCLWTWSGGIPGESIGLLQASLLSLGLTVLPCVCAGSVVGAAVHWTETDDNPRTVAWLYCWETLGAVVAGLAVTFVLVPLAHWWFSVGLLVGVPLCIGQGRRGAVVALPMLAVLWFATPVLDRVADRVASAFLPGEIVVNRDLPKERVTVTELNGQHSFYFSGSLVGADRQKEASEELAWYSSLAAPRNGRALFIGFGYNGPIRELVARGFAVTVVDPDPLAREVVQRFLLPADQRVLTNMGVRMLHIDPRELRAHVDTQFDLVIQCAGVPETYATARLYTAEWFEILRRALVTNGVAVVALPASPGYVPDDLARILARVEQTMTDAGLGTAIIPASQTLLVGRKGAPLPTDVGSWLVRWRARATSTVWFTEALIADQLNVFRQQQYSNALAAVGTLRIDHDMEPLVYGDALRYSEARFQDPLHTLLRILYDAPVKLYGGVIVLAVLLAVAGWAARATRWPRVQLLTVMVMVSAMGFVGEMIVIVRLTLMHGSPYYIVGLLFAAFMAGLATATALLHSAATATARRAVVLCGILLVTALFILVYVPGPMVGFTLFIAGLNALVGFCVGGVFALAARLAAGLPGSGTVLYAADMGGAMAGAILFGIVIPPVIGFAPFLWLGVAMLIATVSLCALPTVSRT